MQFLPFFRGFPRLPTLRFAECEKKSIRHGNRGFLRSPYCARRRKGVTAPYIAEKGSVHVMATWEKRDAKEYTRIIVMMIPSRNG